MPRNPKGAPEAPAVSTAADRLRSVRARLDLTLDEVAAIRGIARQSYAQHESGKRIPTLNWLWDHAQALGIDPHELDPRLQSNRGA